MKPSEFIKKYGGEEFTDIKERLKDMDKMFISKIEVLKLKKKIYDIMKQEEQMSYYWHDVEKEINEFFRR